MKARLANSKKEAKIRCPSCKSRKILTDYYTDETYCLACGLVLG